MIVPDRANDDFLFAALDGGVYYSENNGNNWDYVGIDLPLVTISELHLDADNEKLIAGTYSRSMWSYDVSWIDFQPSTADVKDESNLPVTTYPNPVVDFLNFKGNISGLIKIYNHLGQLVHQETISSKSHTLSINLSQLSSGLYYYKN